ncbi:preprotein translocase subunit YajC [Minwuia thermotolerans]|uniref:Sec translocon accessory complex subunit YajC n=1 Tax=Minwuia thermotolerans TaxID=2056226 RepID=A0A2M9G1N4_9PROT|nr:preprotein translocase subunit YajC [Minwuia thermotolerans]PJK29621.1 preprotein translocase subunit YajC [Minwuia thermotolerans]
MWISPAYAQAAGGDGGGLMTFLPLILIFVVFYFLLIRPQQKKAKEHRQMVQNVRRGDTVVTGGGIVGKVTKVKDEQTIQLEIAEGVRIDVVKGTLADVRSKTAPANDPAPANKDGGEGGGGLMGKLGLKK